MSEQESAFDYPLQRLAAFDNVLSILDRCIEEMEDARSDLSESDRCFSAATIDIEFHRHARGILAGIRARFKAVSEVRRKYLEEEGR